MAKACQKPPFWRRGKPNPKYDIALLRPATEPKGKRFETPADARQESERSEQLLRSFPRHSKTLADYLAECRAGDYKCNKPFCPICARRFRRWFIGELLRITKGDEPVRIYTVLLKEAPQDKIDDLDPTTVRHRLRKQLERAGLGKVPVIGGVEIIYKAKKRLWVLHANLAMIGGRKAARKKFEQSFQGSGIERPITRARLKKNPPKHLSYTLKFSTYHRPHEQHGSKKSKAKPLNGREHAALVKWMFPAADQRKAAGRHQGRSFTTCGQEDLIGVAILHELYSERVHPLMPLIALCTGKDWTLNNMLSG